MIAVETEESPRTLRALWIADEEFHVEMTDYFHAASVQLRVEPGEPLAALAMAADGKMRGVTAPERRVCQAPEMRAIKADLCNLRFRIIDKRQIAWIGIARPMRDHTGELDPFRRVNCAGEQQPRGEHLREPERNPFRSRGQRR